MIIIEKMVVFDPVQSRKNRSLGSNGVNLTSIGFHLIDKAGRVHRVFPPFAIPSTFAPFFTFVHGLDKCREHYSPLRRQIAPAYREGPKKWRYLKSSNLHGESARFPRTGQPFFVLTFANFFPIYLTGNFNRSIKYLLFVTTCKAFLSISSHWFLIKRAASSPPDA